MPEVPVDEQDALEAPRRRVPDWVHTVAWLLALTVGLAALVLYNAVGYLGGHNGADTRLQMLRMQEALVTYAAKHRGRFPERLEDAAAYFPNDEVPTDAWGNPFLYLSGTAGSAYVLVSLGADGRPGGEGADADVRSDRPE